MAGAAKTPAPIDRPLSRSYLREFSGWSTAYPPGLADPTSLRVMDNVMVNRDGSLRVRPGLRYLSYAAVPSLSASDQNQQYRYLKIPMEDVVNRAAPDFDDSSWDIGLQPFGTDPSAKTNFPAQSAIWLRTTVLGSAGVDIKLSGQLDNYLDVYLNGEKITTVNYNDKVAPAYTVTIPGAKVRDGANLLALRVSDDPTLYSGDGTLLSIKLSGTADTGVKVVPGIAYARPFVGTHEAFYLNDGTKAYLCAVRETDNTVGFRVMVHAVNDSAMYALTDPLIDFELLSPVSALNFSTGTTYVKFLQIDNKILALSDNGEPIRLFSVGAYKYAKALTQVHVPGWSAGDKLTVVHPDAAWINGRKIASRRENKLTNSNFEHHLAAWTPSSLTSMSRASGVVPVAGTRVLKVTSKPTRTNLCVAPLYDVDNLGHGGWSATVPGTALGDSNGYLKVSVPGGKDHSFYAGTTLLPGARAGKAYKIAFDRNVDAGLDAKCVIRFLGLTGADVGSPQLQTVPAGIGRWVSGEALAPAGTVSLQIEVGGRNETAGTLALRLKNVVVCEASEPTDMFTGNSGANYFWSGSVNASASTYHPPVDVELTATSVSIWGPNLVGSLSVRAGSTARSATLTMSTLDKSWQASGSQSTAATPDTSSGWTRLSVTMDPRPAGAVRAYLKLKIAAVPRGELHYVDAAMIEIHTNVLGDYFDGDTADTSTTDYRWLHEDLTDRGSSVAYTYSLAAAVPAAETPTVDTLVASGGRKANGYNYGFFYSFSNEVGETSFSQLTTGRMQRAWSEWTWETPNDLGEPSGTETNDPLQCADQLVAYMPEDTFTAALAQGATSWSLYMLTWSDQEPVPVVGLKVGEKVLKPGASYTRDGWIQVTPQQANLNADAPLPTGNNILNSSIPPCAAQGLVAADRMILVNDPSAPGTIRWTSDRAGEYTNFTPRLGGGVKTLTSGNQFVPAAVKLWQNPQSVDTLTVLCLGTDGYSASYYMAPAEVSGQTDAVQFMGFEQTTATPGTASPYGVEVLNNALYQPLEDELMKSVASNYNINHSTLTDDIKNMWRSIRTKQWIISCQLDNRLYYLVYNGEGEALESGCKGNEIWVYDAAQKQGSWSRFTIQAGSLRKLEFGGKLYLSVVRPDGVFYLDPDYGLDDYVAADKSVLSRPIAWSIETNTQGANRAHDAWAHLQQCGISLGSFAGQLRWGVRGWDVNGRPVEVAKVTTDTDALADDGLPYDVEDFLLVRRDMKEWRFFAESLPSVPSSGQISLVQYRYTPVSVNVGYEYGSVETFEYTRALAAGNSATSFNGVPAPAIETRRP